MTQQPAPPGVEALARRRAAARAAHDYAAADALRAEIESAGWKVVDAGTEFRLEPASLSAALPSRLDEPAMARATIVIVDPASAGPAADVQLVDAAALIPAGGTLAAAWNAGLRVATGELVLFWPAGARMDMELAVRALAALEDESVAIAGSHGLASADMRRWQPAPAGEVDALDAGLLCFRRDDGRQRGPLDERFVTPRHLAVWWSLLLRDEGPARPPRRAVAFAADGRHDLALPADPPRERAERRDFYRLLDRFGARRDLLAEAAPVRPRTG